MRFFTATGGQSVSAALAVGTPTLSCRAALDVPDKTVDFSARYIASTGLVTPSLFFVAT